MSDAFIDEIRREIENIEAEMAADPRALKLWYLRDLLALYEGSHASDDTPDRRQQKSQAAGRRMSPDRLQILDHLEAYLQGNTEPTPTRELVEYVDILGLKIGGTDKVANLSAMLSNARDRFVSNGRAGWTLSSVPDKALLPSSSGMPLPHLLPIAPEGPIAGLPGWGRTAQPMRPPPLPLPVGPDAPSGPKSAQAPLGPPKPPRD